MAWLVYWAIQQRRWLKIEIILLTLEGKSGCGRDAIDVWAHAPVFPERVELTFKTACA